MEENSNYLNSVSIDAVIASIIAETKNQVNKEMLDQVELSKTYDRDKQRIAGLVTLLHEVIRIYKTTKSKIEGEWLGSCSTRTLSSGYDKRIDYAITNLRKKENLEKSLEDVNKDIASNDEILAAIRAYYEARKEN
jgi:hypothetical protein